MHCYAARRTALGLWLFVALAAGGCSTSRELPDVLIASRWLVHLELPSGQERARRFLPSPANGMELAPDGVHVGLALATGMALIRIDSLVVAWHQPLGIVDAVAFHPNGERAYALVHPGDDPHAAQDPHRVVELDLETGSVGQSFVLDRHSFDLTLVADSTRLWVSDLIGRAIHRLDLASGRFDTLRIGGPTPERVLMRTLIPGPDGEWLIPEDDHETVRLHRVAADDSQTPVQNIALAAPILGGGFVGGRYWLHGRRALHCLAPDGTLISQDLALAAREGSYRYADYRGALGVFIAPDLEAQGRPMSWLQCWDLERGERLSRRRIVAAVGPVVLLPSGPAAH